MPGKKVMPTPFRLTEEQQKTLSSRFPDWLFIQTSSSGHDHPISHCTTMIAGYEMLKALPAGSKASPARYLDLHGNPRSNSRMSGDTKRVETLVNLESPKDYIRQATKWGPRVSGGRTNYHLGSLRDLPRDFTDLSQIDRLLSIHTLYYYDHAEVARALAGTAGHTLEAIIHRHEGDCGTLNKGELKWVKEEKADGRVTVKQTNARTGESYIHPCTESYFKKTFWTPHLTQNGELDTLAALTAGERLDSLAWTINAVCEDTYRLTIVAVPAKVAAMDVQAHFDSEPTTSKPNTKRNIMVTGKVSYRLYGEEREVTLRDHHLRIYDSCRTRMINKTRDEQSFKSHAVFVARECHGVAKTVEMTSEEVRDIALASFWVDYEVDVANASAGTFWSRAFAKQQNLILKGDRVDFHRGFTTLIDAAIIALGAKDKKEMCIKMMQLSKTVTSSK